MAVLTHDVFGPGSNFSKRFVKDPRELSLVVAALRKLNMKVVLTMGTYDMLHVGHSRYLEAGRQLGDILIVGVDSDEKVRNRKGPRRPIVSESERLEVLCHVRHVDLVALKSVNDPKWHLIKTVRPDVLLATKTTYTQRQLRALKQYCGRVVVLEPKATTSTTAKVRKLMVDFASEARERISKKVQEALDEIIGGA